MTNAEWKKFKAWQKRNKRKQKNKFYPSKISCLPPPASYGWLKAHPEFTAHQTYDPTAYNKPEISMLFCKNEYIQAQAVWEKRNGCWKCVKSDPEINWMTSTNRNNLEIELLRRGMKWEWI